MSVLSLISLLILIWVAEVSCSSCGAPGVETDSFDKLAANTSSPTVCAMTNNEPVTSMDSLSFYGCTDACAFNEPCKGFNYKTGNPTTCDIFTGLPTSFLIDSICTYYERIGQRANPLLISPAVPARLVGSGLSDKGRLEVFHEGLWGTVCDDSFGEMDARVACSVLGFGYIGYVLGNQYGAGIGNIGLDDVECVGNEASLFDCSHNPVWGVTSCSHAQDVSIACILAIDEVRLAGGGSAGRLEVKHNGVWGTVCDDGFADADARVACYMLGFGHVGTAQANTYGAGSGQIWMDDVECTGSELRLDDCGHAGWGIHNCGHGEDISISCV